MNKILEDEIIDPFDFSYDDEDGELEEEVFEDSEYENISVDVRKIVEETSKGDLFDEFNILQSEQFDHSDFNKEGYYRLEMNDDTLEDVFFLGTNFNNIEPIMLENDKMGINWSDELQGSDIVSLPIITKPNMIIVTMFPDPEHWQHNSKLFFLKLNPYI